ncbi:MAG: hypothetical protein Q9171_001798 [Xanthocarpia ochracea]
MRAISEDAAKAQEQIKAKRVAQVQAGSKIKRPRAVGSVRYVPFLREEYLQRVEGGGLQTRNDDDDEDPLSVVDVRSMRLPPSVANNAMVSLLPFSDDDPLLDELNMPDEKALELEQLLIQDEDNEEPLQEDRR